MKFYFYTEFFAYSEAIKIVDNLPHYILYMTDSWKLFSTNLHDVFCRNKLSFVNNGRKTYLFWSNKQLKGFIQGQNPLFNFAGNKIKLEIWCGVINLHGLKYVLISFLILQILRIISLNKYFDLFHRFFFMKQLL